LYLDERAALTHEEAVGEAGAMRPNEHVRLTHPRNIRRQPTPTKLPRVAGDATAERRGAPCEQSRRVVDILASGVAMRVASGSRTGRGGRGAPIEEEDTEERTSCRDLFASLPP